jgi:UDP-glucose 4-epimerase
MTGKPPLLALTGGSGFIGRHFARAARLRGYRIRHLGRKAPADPYPDDEWQPMDLEAPDAGAPDLENCRAIIHLAAHVPADHQDPAEAERCWRINALGTLALIESAARAGVDRLIQTSSANAYAPAPHPPNEDSPLFPRSRGYYLGSKILQEIYAVERCRTAGIWLQTARLGSVYGADQQSGAPGVMARAAAAGGPIRVAGEGLFGSDLVSVHDVVQALLLLLESDRDGPFNIGSGTRTTVAILAQHLADLTRAPIVHEPAGEEDWGFPALNIGRLKALGYRPTPLLIGLRSMLEALD